MCFILFSFMRSNTRCLPGRPLRRSLHFNIRLPNLSVFFVTLGQQSLTLDGLEATSLRTTFFFLSRFKPRTGLLRSDSVSVMLPRTFLPLPVSSFYETLSSIWGFRRGPDPSAALLGASNGPLGLSAERFFFSFLSLSSEF